VVVSEAGGVRQYVQQSFIDNPQSGVVSGFAAKDGKVLWTAPVGQGPTYALASTAVVRGDLVYVTAGYGYGCHLYKITKSGDKFAAEDQYPRRSQRAMKNTHGGVVLVGDHVYGHSENLGWVCQEFKTSKVAWDDRTQLECKSGAVTAAEGRLYLYSDEGEAVLLEATPRGWKEHGRFTIPQKSNVPNVRPTSRSAAIWAHPVIANGRLYLRDQELLFCFDIRARKK
jgi:outer membrane protein assembly factor BamB